MLLLLQLPLLAAAFRLPSPIANEESVRGVLKRLPSWINDFVKGIDLNDGSINAIDDGVRIVRADGGGIFVEAGSGSSALYGINYFLRNYCDTQITWDGNTYGDGCRDIYNEIFLSAPTVRYFGNPVTFGYSFVWWTWREWERFIDWLAFNGFNAVLAPIGQEAIWRDVFMKDFNLTREELLPYFTGPAFLPWHRMGNLKGYGGPLTDNFMDRQLTLNKQIVARLAELGIIPVLPTFAGFVPDILPDRPHYKTSKQDWHKRFMKSGCWEKFNETYSCLAMVKPNDDVFTLIANKFMRRQLQAYGSLYHVYSADPMNEMSQKSKDIQFIRDMAWSVFAACNNADSDCIWVLQSWEFSYGSWSRQAIKAFLQGVPPGKLLVLDVYAEHYPLWSHTKSFYGHPFVWSMLHNFGGNNELRGNLRHPNKHYQVALTSDTSMVGGGLTMEGIHQNYIMYQFMVDRMWSNSMIDIDKWVKTFVKSRYQTNNKTIVDAWKLIAATFYAQPLNKSDVLHHGKRWENFLYKRPRLLQNIKYWFGTDLIENVHHAFEQVEELLRDNHLFQMDFNDIKREMLHISLANDAVMGIAEGFGTDNVLLRNKECHRVQTMFRELEGVANYDYNKWEEAAMAWGKTPSESLLYARNARAIVSVWGPQGQNLDYAHRSWSGLLTKYYAPRWDYLCNFYDNYDHNPHDEHTFNERIFQDIEKVFVMQGRADIVKN